MKRKDIADIEPKIYEPMENDPGKAPRKVILDRRRKEFNSKSVQHELKLLGINLSDKNDNAEAKLPLEAFDDDSYEIRTPHDWIELATHEAYVKGIPAKALFLKGDKYD
jgi:dynein heavy chain